MSTNNDLDKKNGQSLSKEESIDDPNSGSNTGDAKVNTNNGVDPGYALQKAREAAKLSIKEVADKLHLVSSQIVALENNQYDSFHGEIFCKGYLKSYAKLMSLDADKLLESYAKLYPDGYKSNEYNSAEILHVQTPGKGRSIQYWCFGIMLVVVVSLWALSGDSGEGEESPSLLHDEELLTVDKSDRSLLESLEKQETVETAVETVEAKVDVSEINTADTDGTEEEVDTTSTSTTPQSPNIISKPLALPRLKSAQQSVLPTTDSSDSSDLSAAGNGILNFRFSDDCWLEVTDSENNILESDLKKAEDVLTLKGRAPFKVILGYAPAVSLTYNGKSVSIKGNSVDNTATIVVGRL